MDLEGDDIEIDSLMLIRRGVHFPSKHGMKGMDGIKDTNLLLFFFFWHHSDRYYVRCKFNIWISPS